MSRHLSLVSPSRRDRPERRPSGCAYPPRPSRRSALRENTICLALILSSYVFILVCALWVCKR